MAQPVSDGGEPVRRFRRAQAALAVNLRRDMRSLRRLIVPTRLQRSVPSWIDAVRALLDDYSSASVSLAADFYDAQRELAHVPGNFTTPIPDDPPQGQVDNTLRWATKDLWPRDAEDAATTDAQREPLDVRLDQAEKKAEGAVERLVLNQGRETVREAVRRDRQAVGYARAAALSACSFCALMSSRGMVYKDFAAVGGDANEKFTGADSVIKYHNHCRCQPIPVFKGQRFELSPKAREWDRLYQEYAAGHSGDQLRRFRQALAEHNQQSLPGAF